MTSMMLHNRDKLLRRVQTLTELWKKSSWPFDGLVLLTGKSDDTDVTIYKATAMHYWLVGIEFTETAIGLTRTGEIIFFSSPRKIGMLKQNLAGPKVAFIEKDKDDGSQASSFLEALRGGSSQSTFRVGMPLGQRLVGTWAPVFSEALASTRGFDVVDAKEQISLVLGPKDAEELTFSRRSATLALIIGNDFKEKVTELLDNEVEQTNREVGQMMETKLEDPDLLESWRERVPWMNFDDMALAYVTLQSGSQFSLDPTAEPNDDQVAGQGTYLLTVGFKYVEYSSCIIRTLMVESSAIQKNVYHFVLELQDLVIKALRPGARFSDVYKAALNRVQQQSSTLHIDLSSLFAADVGFVLGMEFRDQQAMLRESCDRVVEPGMVFCVSVGFQERAMPKPWAICVADTVVVNGTGSGQQIEVLTAGCTSRETDIMFDFQSEEEKEDSDMSLNHRMSTPSKTLPVENENSRSAPVANGEVGPLAESSAPCELADAHPPKLPLQQASQASEASQASGQQLDAGSAQSRRQKADSCPADKEPATKEPAAKEPAAASQPKDAADAEATGAAEEAAVDKKLKQTAVKEKASAKRVSKKERLAAQQAEEAAKDTEVHAAKDKAEQEPPKSTASSSTEAVTAAAEAGKDKAQTASDAKPKPKAKAKAKRQSEQAEADSEGKSKRRRTNKEDQTKSLAPPVAETSEAENGSAVSSPASATAAPDPICDVPKEPLPSGSNAADAEPPAAAQKKRRVSKEEVAKKPASIIRATQSKVEIALTDQAIVVHSDRAEDSERAVRLVCPAELRKKWTADLPQRYSGTGAEAAGGVSSSSSAGPEDHAIVATGSTEAPSLRVDEMSGKPTISVDYSDYTSKIPFGLIARTERSDHGTFHQLRIVLKAVSTQGAMGSIVVRSPAGEEFDSVHSKFQDWHKQTQVALVAAQPQAAPLATLSDARCHEMTLQVDGKRLPLALEVHGSGFRLTVHSSLEALTGAQVAVLYSSIDFTCVEASGTGLLYLHLKESVDICGKSLQNLLFSAKALVNTTEGKSKASGTSVEAGSLREFDSFCIYAASVSGLELERLTGEETILGTLQQRGVVGRRPLYLSQQAFLALEQKHPFCLKVADIDLVIIERNDSNAKKDLQIDLVIIRRDYSLRPLRITNIANEDFQRIAQWLLKVKVVWYTYIARNDWNSILKSILRNPPQFFQQGGWSRHFKGMEWENHAVAVHVEAIADADKGEAEYEEEQEEEGEDEDDEDDDDEDDEGEVDTDHVVKDPPAKQRN